MRTNLVHLSWHRLNPRLFRHLGTSRTLTRRLRPPPGLRAGKTKREGRLGNGCGAGVEPRQSRGNGMRKIS